MSKMRRAGRACAFPPVYCLSAVLVQLDVRERSGLLINDGCFSDGCVPFPEIPG